MQTHGPNQTHNQSICLSDTSSKQDFFVSYTIAFWEKKVSYWFVRACNTQEMREGPEPAALGGNLVTEFLTRDISDGLLRLPWLLFWNDTVWKNIFKRWLQSLESKASYKLTKVGNPLALALLNFHEGWILAAELSADQMGKQQNSSTVFKCLSQILKGQKKRETWHPSLFCLLFAGDDNYCLKILQWDKSWK